MVRVVPWDVILPSLIEWREAQPDILRDPRPLTMEDQEQYKRMLLAEDCRRFGNRTHMWPVTDGDEFIAWGGLTNMEWYGGQVLVAETSFIARPDITADDTDYTTVFGWFLSQLLPIFFSPTGYWKGHRLHSETYDLPHRACHIRVLESRGFKREGVLRDHHVRHGMVCDVILHGVIKTDVEVVDV
jgi:hypothetical protein